MLFYSLKLSTWKGFLSREKRTKIPFIFSCKSPYHKDNVNPAFLGPALGITRESSQGTSAKRTCSLDISARCSPLGLRSSSRVCRNRYTIVRNWRNSWSHVITQMEELLKSYNNDKFLGEKRDSHSVFVYISMGRLDSVSRCCKEFDTKDSNLVSCLTWKNSHADNFRVQSKIYLRVWLYSIVCNLVVFLINCIY